MNKNVIVFADNIGFFRNYLEDQHGIYHQLGIYPDTIGINQQVYFYCYEQHKALSTKQPVDILLLYGWYNKRWSVKDFVRHSLSDHGSTIVGDATEISSRTWQEFMELEKQFQNRNRPIEKISLYDMEYRFSLMDL